MQTSFPGKRKFGAVGYNPTQFEEAKELLLQLQKSYPASVETEIKQLNSKAEFDNWIEKNKATFVSANEFGEKPENHKLSPITWHVDSFGKKQYIGGLQRLVEFIRPKFPSFSISIHNQQSFDKTTITTETITSTADEENLVQDFEEIVGKTMSVKDKLVDLFRTEMKRHVESLQHSKQEYTLKLSSAEASLSEANAKLIQKDEEIRSLLEKNKRLEAQVYQLNQEIERLKKKIAELEAEIKKLTDNLNSETVRNRDALNKEKSAKESLEEQLRQRNRELQELKDKVSMLERSLNETSKSSSTYKTQLDNLTKENGSLKIEVDNLKKHYRDLEKAKNEAELLVNQLKIDIKNLNEEFKKRIEDEKNHWVEELRSSYEKRLNVEIEKNRELHNTLNSKNSEFGLKESELIEKFNIVNEHYKQKTEKVEVLLVQIRSLEQSIQTKDIQLSSMDKNLNQELSKLRKNLEDLQKEIISYRETNFRQKQELDEYKGERSKIIKENLDLRDEKSKLEIDLKSEQEKYINQNKTLERLTKLREELRNNIERMEAENNKMKRDISELINDKELNDHDLKNLRIEVQTLCEQRDSSNRECNSLKIQIVNLTKELENLRARVLSDADRQQLVNHENKIKDLQNSLDDERRRHENLKSQHLANLSSLDQIRKEYESLQKQLELKVYEHTLKNSERVKIESELSEKTKLYEEATAKLTRLNNDLKETSEECQRKSDEASKYYSLYKRTEEQVIALTNELNDLKKSKSNEHMQLQILQERIAKYEKEIDSLREYLVLAKADLEKALALAKSLEYDRTAFENAKKDISRLEAEIAELIRNKGLYLKEIEDLRNKLQELPQIQMQRDIAVHEKNKIADAIQMLRDKTTEAEKLVAALRRDLDLERKNSANFQKRIEEIKLTSEKLKSDLDASNRTLLDVTNQRDHFKKLADDERKSLGDIQGALSASNLKCTELTDNYEKEKERNKKITDEILKQKRLLDSALSDRDKLQKEIDSINSSSKTSHEAALRQKN